MTSQFSKDSPGTVLLRQAEPKYKYSARKLPKQAADFAGQPDINIQHGIKNIAPSSPMGLNLEANTNSIDKSQSNQVPYKSVPLQSQTIISQGNRPIAVVGASVQSPDQNNKQLLFSGTNQDLLLMNENPPYLRSNVSSTPNNTNIVNSSTIPPITRSVTLPTSTYNHPPSTTFHTQDDDNKLIVEKNFSSRSDADTPVMINCSAAAVALSGVTNEMLNKRLAEVEKERDKLKKDLDAQLQVNSELKRLLVASVGDDLGKRVERLAQDRVQLSMDIGGFSKKMTEDYENLDKISIQADMWRSKYLASRVMVEELGNARAYCSLQWHESQDALQQMLNERHQLRTNLLEAYRTLQQVKDAFDPLNSHRSTSLPSTNVLDLSRSCQQLSEAVRFRLLPAHVSMPSFTLDPDLEVWSNSVTKAEQYAHELLSRPSEPTGSLQSDGPSNVLPIMRSPSQSRITRFHPQVRHENLTVHCIKCKGDIHVI